MQLPGIASLCGVNIGGLGGGCLRVFPVDNVQLVPPVVNGLHVGELVLTDPDNFADLWFLDGSGQYQEPDEENEQGDRLQARLSITVPRDAPDVAVAIQRYRELRYFLALYQDANGLCKLVGSREWPLRFRGALSTGQRTGDPNGYTLQFAAEQPAPAAFYHTFAGSASERRVFSAGFSFGFLRTRLR